MTSVAHPTAVSALEANDITVRFGGLVALEDVSLDVPPRSIVGLVGPNGAGKTTLFNVLSGFITPNSGQVLLAGEDVTRKRTTARARLGLSRTFQHVELFMGLSVREHVVISYRAKHVPGRVYSDFLSGRAFRAPAKAETEEVDRLLDLLGLSDIGHQMAGGLSTGVSRLVEIARALASEPGVLLLDEPSSGLDPSETERLVAVLRRVRDESGTSLLLVEHDVGMVLGLSDRVHVLDFGRKIAEGTSDEVRRDAAVRSAYLGESDD